MSEKKITVRWINKHTKECAGIRHTKENLWDTPWAYIANEETKFGWRIVVCNDPNCNGRLMFLVNDVLKLLPVEKDTPHE